MLNFGRIVGSYSGTPKTLASNIQQAFKTQGLGVVNATDSQTDEQEYISLANSVWTLETIPTRNIYSFTAGDQKPLSPYQHTNLFYLSANPKNLKKNLLEDAAKQVLEKAAKKEWFKDITYRNLNTEVEPLPAPKKK